MIRKFEKNDINQIMTIWLKTNISAHSFIDKEYWEKAYNMVLSLLPSSDIYIWQVENSIQAFIGLTDNSYIAGLFVHEKYQSQGIGKKLLDHVKELCPHLELDVFVENKGAVRFYQNNGFTVIRKQTKSDFNHIEYHMIWTA